MKIKYLIFIFLVLNSATFLFAQTPDPIEKESGYAINQIAYSLSKYEYLSDANTICQLANRNALLASDVLSRKFFLLKGEVTSVLFDEIFGGYTINIQSDNSKMLIQSYRNDENARTDAKKVIIDSSYYMLFFVTNYRNNVLTGELLVAGKTIRGLAKEFVRSFPNEIHENACDVCLSNLIHNLVSVINNKRNTLKKDFGVNEMEGIENYTDSNQNEEMILKGTINNKYEIAMQIIVDKKDISGSYYYIKNGSNNKLKLSGSMNSNDYVILKECNFVGEHTGTFEGKWNLDNYFGTFTNYKGIKMPFNLHRE